MTWQNGKYKAAIVQAAHQSAGSAMYSFPWPQEIAGLGAREIVPYSPCGDCGRWGSCASYGGRALCLAHAQERAAVQA